MPEEVEYADIELERPDTSEEHRVVSSEEIEDDIEGSTTNNEITVEYEIESISYSSEDDSTEEESYAHTSQDSEESVEFARPASGDETAATSVDNLRYARSLSQEESLRQQAADIEARVDALLRKRQRIVERLKRLRNNGDDNEHGL